ncbi:MAG TPA: DUF4402 domain-containing protein [Sphingomicrobium sp.]|nr:DUF4402 domain-containing protein [Sphingomicrobium sp.]
MSIRSKFILAVAATVLGATSASAAPVSSPTPPTGRALLLIPLTLTKVQDLHFGTIIPSTTTQVTVTIDPSTGARNSSLPSSLHPGDVGQKAYFAGAGTPNQQVIMAMTPPASLSDGLGNSITVVAMFLDGPNTRTIDPVSQAFYVGVGGVIQVQPNQPDGLYSATYDLTADYQ